MPTRSTIRKWSIAGALVASIAAGLASSAHAQTWPSRHVHLIVPYPPGGGADAIARVVGAKLGELWGQQVLIENRGGAGRQYRVGGRGALRAGRLYALSRGRIPGQQRLSLSQAQLRSDRGFHAGVAGRAVSDRHCRAQLVAGTHAGGVH